MISLTLLSEVVIWYTANVSFSQLFLGYKPRGESEKCLSATLLIYTHLDLFSLSPLETHFNHYVTAMYNFAVYYLSQ